MHRQGLLESKKLGRQLIEAAGITLDEMQASRSDAEPIKLDHKAQSCSNFKPLVGCAKVLKVVA